MKENFVMNEKAEFKEKTETKAKSEMKEKDQNEFFLWFKRVLQKDQRRLMSEELMIELFRKKIV